MYGNLQVRRRREPSSLVSGDEHCHLHTSALAYAFASCICYGQTGWACQKLGFWQEYGGIAALPDLSVFKSELQAAFQPPKRDLHDYVQEVRFLVASIVSQTMLRMFRSSFEDSERDLFAHNVSKEYPESLEVAISSALREEFSQKHARTDGTNYPKSSQGRAKSHGSPGSMDLSSIEAKREGRSQGRSSKFHRCNEQRQFAYECRAPAPESNNRRPGQDQQRSRLAPGSNTGTSVRTPCA